MDSILSSLAVPPVHQLVNLPSKPPMKWEQLAQNVPSKSTVSEQFILIVLFGRISTGSDCQIMCQ